jgi:cytochrome oxidase assembly protein ShyY1
MMREGMAQWDYVIAAYALGLIALALLIVWAWRSMRQAEARRDATRRR